MSFELGKYDDVIKYANQFLINNKDSSKAYQLIGRSLKSLGKIKDSIIIFNKALSIDPQDIEILKELGNLNQIIGKKF